MADNTEHKSFDSEIANVLCKSPSVFDRLSGCQMQVQLRDAEIDRLKNKIETMQIHVENLDDTIQAMFRILDEDTKQRQRESGRENAAGH